MAKEPKKVTGDVDASLSTSTVGDSEIKKTKKKKKGLFSKIWNSVFRSQSDDFEKRLQHITKEEAAILSRMRRRSQSWRRMIRNFIILSVLLEVMAVGYAIMTTRTPELDWKMRASRVLPMFLLPGLSFLTYLAANSFSRMLDRKDHKTVERLRAERQAKIDELKEKTNYYTTQQLIQRYDPDPAAKAAAATVLASKLGSDSGLNVYVGDESNPTLLGKSSDIELVPSGGLRNRKQVQTRGSSTGSTVLHPHEEEMLHQTVPEELDISSHQQLVVEHHQQTGSSTQGGGWLARFAALLVGEDPTQSYALICGNCHMHNGLARKEDFPYVTYYCPHCSALNRPKQLDEHVSESNSPDMSSSTTVSDVEVAKNAASSTVEKTGATSCPLSPVDVASRTAESNIVASDVPVS